MSEPEEGVRLSLDHGELIALYIVLNRSEQTLDTLQKSILGRITLLLYQRLSVSEMENIDEYYSSLTKETT